MKILYELYIRFMVWLFGAAPPAGYEYLLNSRHPIQLLFESDDVQENKSKLPNPIPSVLISLFIFTALLIWSGQVGLAPDWTGFGEKIRLKDDTIEYQSAKTLWDWLQLLVIPGVLFGVGFWVNSTVRKSERETEIDRLRENVLQNYFDKMTELLLEQGLILQRNVADKIKTKDKSVVCFSRWRTKEKEKIP